MPERNAQPSLSVTSLIVDSGTFPAREGGGGAVSIGYVVQFAGNFVIRGTEATDGFEASIAANTALFSILGTTYGGNGQSTFSMPELRGNLAAGVGSGPGLTHRTLGEAFGSDDFTIAIPNLPPSFGGSSLPIGNAETTLTTNFVINVFGVYPTPDSGGPRLDLIGMVHQFAGNFEPNGAMFCDGRLLPISEYEALFTIIGTTYGGDGETTFALPDLRGRVPVGTGTGPGLSTVYLGEASGTEAILLTNSAMPTGAGGGGFPFTNMQPTLGLTTLVAINGIFRLSTTTASRPVEASTGKLPTWDRSPTSPATTRLAAGRWRKASCCPSRTIRRCSRSSAPNSAATAKRPLRCPMRAAAR